MVKLCDLLLNLYRKKSRPHFRPKFLDSLRLTVCGGHGGNGLPKYGGIGGQGGCVLLEANEKTSLKDVERFYNTKRINASHGEDSSKNRILGRRGLDEKIKVPVGIQVLDQAGKIVADLNKAGATCLVAGGGVGGCTGNSFLGGPGESQTITLDLKLIADIGLVGFPNAGKSTFLQAVSKAKPKIASYPFTTIRPQIGIIEYEDYRQVSVADLPGLIEGAHANIGMGHKFLKHVERTRLLLMIVDVFGFQLSSKHKSRNCLENLFALNKELELYDETLLEKPCVLLINKMDLDNSKKEYLKFEKQIHDLKCGLDMCPEDLRPKKIINFDRVMLISGKTSFQVDEVKSELRKVLDEVAEKKLEGDYETNSIHERLRERGPKIT